MGANHSRRREREGTTVTHTSDPRADLRARARGDATGDGPFGEQQQQQRHPRRPRNVPVTTTTGGDDTGNINNDGVITKKTSTIRNHVNVKKSSVKMMSSSATTDAKIEFTYDATKKCAASVYVCQKGWMTSGSKFASVAYRKPCDAGFSETVSVAVSKAKMNSLRSLKNNNEEKDGFAVVIQLECVGDQVEMQEEANRALFAESFVEDATLEGKERFFDPEKAFDTVDPSVQAQVTYCSAPPQFSSTTEENLVKLQVVKQHIFVNGSSYELQEIYGIDNNPSNNNSLEELHNVEQFQQQQEREDDDEVMCVVCLTEPKNTTVLPCRHMCMCSECARALRFQSNKCPICRNPVESLLEISIAAADV